MSKNSFVKYQGAGNDFILIDDRAISFDPSIVPTLCNRKLGVGADGVILLQNDPRASFRMRIYNPDGNEAESCGNGLRCLLSFILELGFSKKSYEIATGDRIVTGEFIGDLISIHMGAPKNLKILEIEGKKVYSVDTGVPHVVLFVPDVEKVDLAYKGPFLRNHPFFKPRGTNVNFATVQPDGSIRVRTFERGVEGETLACGTGAAAVGVVGSHFLNLKSPIQTRFSGGVICIHVDGFNDVRMVGGAQKVFAGTF